jgi:hypothetical protein
VKILLDHGTPAPLRLAFTSHSVVTAYEKGWAAEIVAAAVALRPGELKEWSYPLEGMQD